MDSTRGRRKRAAVAEPARSREVPESLPPPRPARERSEYDPEALWDSETDESSEERETEGESNGEQPEEGDPDQESFDDLGDWDHPLRGLKIN